MFCPEDLEQRVDDVKEITVKICKENAYQNVKNLKCEDWQERKN